MRSISLEENYLWPSSFSIRVTERGETSWYLQAMKIAVIPNKCNKSDAKHLCCSYKKEKKLSII